MFGLLTLCLGQDANWDLRNYHFYNPYAFLHHRFDYDIAPAQVANFYNPLLYVPYYWLVSSLPPLAAALVLGALQGLNFPLLIGIARSVMADEQALPWWVAFLIALFGLLGAGNISELGTMFADNLLSLLVLGGIWLLLAHFKRLGSGPLHRALLLAACCGLLFGLAAGLKQPAAIFCVGWCAAQLTVPARLGRRLGLAIAFGLGVLAGIAAGGGYWMYELWERFGNPLFPYFNHIFASPMASLATYRDARFVPKSILEAIFFPFIIAVDPYQTAETPFRDLRFALFALLVLTAGLIGLYRRLAGRQTPGAALSHDAAVIRRKRLFLLCGGLVAYAAWLRLFAIYRYLLLLEMLAPLGIWLLICTIAPRERVRSAAAVGCAVLWLATLQPGNWGRITWGRDMFGVEPPRLSDPDHTLVLMTGVSPMAYVVPFFPAKVRFLRIQSYFTGPSSTPNGSDLLMQQLVANQRGPLYVLFSHWERSPTDLALQAYGLAVDPGDCRVLKDRMEEQIGSSLDFCAVRRVDSHNPFHGENR